MEWNAVSTPYLFSTRCCDPLLPYLRCGVIAGTTIVFSGPLGSRLKTPRGAWQPRGGTWVPPDDYEGNFDDHDIMTTTRPRD